MIVYFLTIFTVILLCYLAERTDGGQSTTASIDIYHHTRTSTIFYSMAAVILVCVGGFRYYVGSDYGAYYLGYQEYINGLRDAVHAINEPGYGLIALVSSRLGYGSVGAIFIALLVSIAIPMIVIYMNTSSLLLSTVLLIIMGFWHGSFNGVRQYLAIAIVFSGYSFLRDRELLKYLIVVFIAYLFHKSAAVMALAYFVLHRRISAINTLLLLAAVYIALRSYNRVFYLTNILMSKDYDIHGGYTSHAVNRLRLLAACLPATIFLYEYRDVRLNEVQTFHMNIVLIYAAIRLTTMNSALLFRVGAYMTPFMTIALPHLLNDISRRDRRLVIVLIVTVFSIMWWYELSISSDLKQFHWIWESNAVY